VTTFYYGQDILKKQAQSVHSSNCWKSNNYTILSINEVTHTVTQVVVVKLFILRFCVLNTLIPWNLRQVIRNLIC